MKKETWLRISYWSAAIGDFILAILVLIPQVNGESQYSLLMGMMSSAAFSWGIMMIYADRKPMERRWVLLPTILVGSLLAIVNIYAVYSGINSIIPSFLRITPFFINIFIWTFSYIISNKPDKSNPL